MIMITNFFQYIHKSSLVATMVAGLLISSSAHSETLLEFNFENFDLYDVTGVHSFAVSSAISGSHDMANNGIEFFGPPHLKLSMTRFADDVTFPALTFTTTMPMRLDTIDFMHIHNHTPGYAVYPNYYVNLDLDSGSGFITIGTFLAEPNGYDSDSISGPGLLPAGTYTLRWVALVEPDTNTAFFGLDNIRLMGSFLDSDEDGVTDDLDHCPTTMAGAVVDTNGCSGSQLIKELCVGDDEWKNHGAYVKCVAHASEYFLNVALITQEEKDAIVVEAAKSNYGHKNR